MCVRAAIGEGGLGVVDVRSSLMGEWGIGCLTAGAASMCVCARSRQQGFKKGHFTKTLAFDTVNYQIFLSTLPDLGICKQII